MNVTQLMHALEDALLRGLDPDTAVVVSYEGDWKEIGKVMDPTQEYGYIWFSLDTADWADERVTPAHYQDDEQYI